MVFMIVVCFFVSLMIFYVFYDFFFNFMIFYGFYNIRAHEGAPASTGGRREPASGGCRYFYMARRRL